MRQTWFCFLAAMFMAASPAEQVPAQEVGMEGLIPVCGKDVEDGVYEVTVESSSSMFRIEHARLKVRNGDMAADITLGGTGYRFLFMGTGAEAAAAAESEYIPYIEDDDGKYTYTIPVKALDEPIACAAFSKRKEKWYDRQLLVQAESLPPEAVKTSLPDYDALRKEARRKRIQSMREAAETKEAQGGNSKEGADGGETTQPARVELEDGEYRIDTEFQGGTGRAAVLSPSILMVRDHTARARIRWNSSNYDYMKVGEEICYPEYEGGCSVFEIPVTAFDQEMEVIGDTTAMSVPHEITYTLTFRLESAAPYISGESEALQEQPSDGTSLSVSMHLAAAVAAGALFFLWRKKKDKRRNGE